MWKWSHYAIIETVEPFKLHPISMSYIYKVFEHLEQVWMGIRQQIHTITTTDVSSDLGEFTEIRDDVSVEMIPLRNRWDCRTFQTAFHTIVETVEPFKLHPISMSYIYKVFEHLEQFRMGIWQHIHTVTTTDVSPDLGKVSEIIWCKCGNDPTTLSLRW